MKIGDEVYIHGYIDEIRNDVVIIRNEGGYFGTDASEVILADRKTESDSEKPNNCETCRYEGECDWKQWQKCYCEPQSVRSNLEPFRVDEPQTVLNDYSKADDCMECEKFFDCDAPDEVKHASRVTDCAWMKGE